MLENYLENVTLSMCAERSNTSGVKQRITRGTRVRRRPTSSISDPQTPKYGPSPEENQLWYDDNTQRNRDVRALNLEVANRGFGYISFNQL